MAVYSVTGAADWSPRVSEAEDEVLMLTATCPRCGTPHRMNYQAPPWSIPSQIIYAGQSDLLEDHRSRGIVTHEEVSVLTVDLRCPRCGLYGEAQLAAG